MRGRPPQISEEALLDAAAAVFLRDGAAATTAEIARRAGVSEGLIFYRYKTKEDLVAAVIGRQMQPPEALLALVRDPGERPIAGTLRELCGHVLTALRRAFPYVELARSSAGSAAIQRSVVRSGATPDRLVDLVARFFEGEAARGRLRRVTPSLAGRLVVGVCLERVLSEALPVGRTAPDDDEDFLRGLADVLLHGAAPEARARRRHRR